MTSMMSTRIRKIKVAAMSAVMMGMAYGAACTIGDIRHNIANGTLSFVKSYTGDVWEAIIPPADQDAGR